MILINHCVKHDLSYLPKKVLNFFQMCIKFITWVTLNMFYSRWSTWKVCSKEFLICFINIIKNQYLVNKIEIVQIAAVLHLHGFFNLELGVTVLLIQQGLQAKSSLDSKVRRTYDEYSKFQKITPVSFIGLLILCYVYWATVLI